MGRFVLFAIVLFWAAPLQASGFVSSKGQLFFKLEARLERSNGVFDASGHRNNEPETSGIEMGLESQKLLVYISYGLSERLTVALSTQYVETTFDPIFGPNLTRRGFSDAWLEAAYQLLPRHRWGLVAHAGLKQPFEGNQPRFPQITSGEPEYEIGLGAGRGWQSGYLEAELGYRFKTGTVNNVGVGGIAFEDEWLGRVKAGYRIRQWLFEGWLGVLESTADLGQESYIPGVFSNSDWMALDGSVSYALNRIYRVGIAFGTKILGTNTMDTQAVSVFISAQL